VSPTKTSCFGLEKRRFSDSKTSCFGVSSRLFLSFKSIQPHTHLAVFSFAKLNINIQTAKQYNIQLRETLTFTSNSSQSNPSLAYDSSILSMTTEGSCNNNSTNIISQRIDITDHVNIDISVQKMSHQSNTLGSTKVMYSDETIK